MLYFYTSGIQKVLFTPASPQTWVMLCTLMLNLYDITRCKGLFQFHYKSYGTTIMDVVHHWLKPYEWPCFGSPVLLNSLEQLVMVIVKWVPQRIISHCWNFITDLMTIRAIFFPANDWLVFEVWHKIASGSLGLRVVVTLQ